MEARSDPGVKNRLADTRSLHERVELMELVQSLVAHPGWALMDELVTDSLEHHGANLQREASKVALSVDPKDAIRFAGMQGVIDGMSFHRDVVASVLESAKSAVAELKRTAALDEAAERV